MGSCYSSKAGGGKYTYSSVQMASTKLDDSGHLARPTPYSRGVLANASLSARKGIPVSTKYEHSVRPGNSNLQNTLTNAKNSSPMSSQSSIPRFSSNVTSAVTKVEVIESNDNAARDRNENSDNAIHIVNNNTVLGTYCANDSTEIAFKSAGYKLNVAPVVESKKEKFNVGSKSYPDNISRQIRMEDRTNASKIPAKFMSPGVVTQQRSLLPQCVSKSSHAISHMNVDSESTSRACLDSFDKSKSANVCEQNVTVSNGSPVDVLVESSISRSFVNSDSHDSIPDFDSGLGSSLTEKSKQEDGDTLKDVERIECSEETWLMNSTPVGKGNSISAVDETASKVTGSEVTKHSLKCPTYKRGINGKWAIEDKSLDDFQKNHSTEKLKMTNNHFQVENSLDKNQCMSSNSKQNFPTYAAYKGLISCKAYSSKHSEQLSSQPNYKCLSSEKHSKVFQSKTKNIPDNPILNFEKADKKFREDGKMQHVISPAACTSLSCNNSSSENEEKSDCVGSETKSPTSEIENRVFLIDDEISDQPSLISFASGKTMDNPFVSLQQSVTELHALQMSSTVKTNANLLQNSKLRDRLGSEHRDSLILSSEIGSSCSSIASDDLMLDYEKRSDFPDGTVNEGLASPVRKNSDLENVEDQLCELGIDKSVINDFEDKARKRFSRRSSGPFASTTIAGKEEWRLRSVSLPLRPPRPMSISETDDGCIILDSSSYRLLSQDLNGVKTLLLRLKSVIQEAETINPFGQVNTMNILYQSLVHSDSPSDIPHVVARKSEHTPLGPAGLSVENADLRRQLVLLQQQLAEKDHTIHLLQQQMTKYANFSSTVSESTCSVNAATQTEKPRSLTGSFSSAVDDSSETLVSVQDAFEEHVSKSAKEQNSFQSQMEEMSNSLSNLYQDLHSSVTDCSSLNRSHSSAD